MKGVQGTGFFNVVGGNFEGVQAAGFFNATGKKMEGVQASGFFNVAKEVKGAQVSGFFNVAKRVKGTQIGFLNFCDTIQGVPIGFLSFVRKGYKKLDVYGNEVLPANIAFRTGANVFHNIFSVGTSVDPTSSNAYFAFGYGVGSDIKLTPKFDLSIDAIGHEVRRDFKDMDRINLLGQFRVNLVFKTFKKFAVMAGPAYNIYITQFYNSDTGKYGMGLEPYSFYNKTYSGNNNYNTNIKMWVGGTLGIRIF
jgi:hypothetical protein